MATIELVIPGLLVTTNQERARSRWDRAKTTAETRRVAALLARVERVPRFEWVHVTVHPHIRTRPGRIPDVAAHMPSVKAAIDGLVDAGVLEDDDWRRVRQVTMCAPERTDVEGLVLRLTGPLEVE